MLARTLLCPGRMRNPNLCFVMFMSLVMPACAGDDSEVDTTARGASAYQDGESPAPQSMDLEIEVEGTGSIDGLEPECQLDGLSGSFTGLFTGDAAIDEDGAFVAGMASATALFTTPSGCEIPQLEVEAVTRVGVRASIPATQANCDGFCAASAGTDAGAQAECAATCTTQDARIVAEAELSADQVAAVSARNLAGGALGELEVDLLFS